MKRLHVLMLAGVIALTFSTALPAQNDSWHQLRYGWHGPYDDNEVTTVSSISDPPKNRLAVKASALRSDDYNLAAWTGNISRDDGRQEEYGGYRVALAPNRKAGALRLFVRDEAGNEKEVAYFDEHNAVIPNLRVGGTVSGRVTRFYTDGGRFIINWQDDTGKPTGIVYDTHGTTDESRWTAVGKVPIEYF